MCPVLRGELPPIPSDELTGLRDSLERDWGHKTVSTPSGPLLVVRVPAAQPELIRDLEAATEQLPPLDLSGYRGAVLVGDQAHLGVSIDMVRSLVSTRNATEQHWLTGLASELPLGGFTIARLPSDPHRRSRVIIRVEATRVGEMTNRDFDALAETQPKILAECPGGCPPAFAYLLAQEDHVRIDGGRFFQELEDRRRRIEARTDRTIRRKREETYDIVRGHLARLEEQQNRRGATDPNDPIEPRRSSRTRSDPYRSRRPGPSDDPVAQRPPEAERPGPPADLITPRARRRQDPPDDHVIPRPPNSSARAPDSIPEPHRSPPTPSPGTHSGTGAFAAADRHPDEARHLKHLLEQGGYETRERLVVDGVPLALAAARPEGYPRRVLAAFYERLKVDEARRVLRVARGAGAELALVVTTEPEQGVERVTLATNLKVIGPEAVEGLRLD